MQVAIAGGTGYVGDYLVDALLSRHHRPTLLVRAGSEGRVRLAEACRSVIGDVHDDEALAALLEGCEAAIYNIGILREQRGQGITFERMQFEGAQRFIDAAEAAGVRRLLLMSANGAQAEGTAYQRTKFRAEQVALESELQTTVFRPSVIFGDPRGKHEFATQLLEDMVRPPVPGIDFFSAFGQHRGAVRMSPVHVEDVAEAFVTTLEDDAAVGRRYTLGGPDILTWGEMLRRVARAVGTRKMLLPMPIELMKLAAAVLDRLPAFPVTRDQLTMLAEGNIAPPGELSSLIGREPIAFTAETLGYLVAHDKRAA